MSDRPQVLPTRKPGHLLERYSETELPTHRGNFRVVVFREKRTGREHLAMVRGDVHGKEGVPVRLHSECLTSEVLGSLKCDCRAQLDRALDLIAQTDCGVVVYLRQEGRGIGLYAKLDAYQLQSEGLDTYAANVALGYAADERDYAAAAQMLLALGLPAVRLLSNNPDKSVQLNRHGVTVVEEVPTAVHLSSANARYLATKAAGGHALDLTGL